MSLVRFDRATLERAAPAGLVRLARFIGIPGAVAGDTALLGELVRRVGPSESWPPRKLER